MPNIFEIEDELVRIAEGYDALEGKEESIEILAAVEAYFEGLLDAKDKKIDGYCRLVSEFSAKAKARQAEADRVAALARADQAAADRLKARLKTFMEFHAVTRLEGATHKVAIQANGGALPVIVESTWEDNPEESPAWAQRRTVSIDVDALRRRLNEVQAQRLERTQAYAAYLDAMGLDPRERASRMDAFLDDLHAETETHFFHFGQRGTHVRIR